MTRRIVVSVLASLFAVAAPLQDVGAGALESGEAVHAVVRSAHDVTIGSDAGSRILDLPLREGAVFRKGDVLVAFDCARTRAELKAAEAEWRGHQAAYQNNLDLQKYHAAGRNDVQISRAQAEKAAATVEGWQARVAQCEVHAPFDGRVADVLAHVFDLPASTAPILRIVDPDNLEVEMLVPSRAAARVAVGTAFALTIEETGATIPGRVVRVGAAVDPVSQTLKVVGEVAVPAKTAGKRPLPVLPGMSGKADFGAMF